MNEAVLKTGTGSAALAPRPSRWPLRLTLLLLFMIALLTGAVLLIHPLNELPSVSVNLNDWPWAPHLGTEQMPPAHKVVLAAVIVAGLLAALLIVPLAAMLGVLAVLWVAMLAVGLPLMLLLGVLALLLSPLLLLIWLLWKWLN